VENPLTILLVESHPESVAPLTDYLLGLRHRVEHSPTAQKAFAAIFHNQRTGRCYDLVLSNQVLPDLHSIGLLREIRRRRDQIAFAIYGSFSQLTPAMIDEATQLGCLMLLDLPVETRRIDQLLHEYRSRRVKTPPANAEQPFFGTGRAARPVGGSTSRYGTGRLARPAGETAAVPVAIAPPATAVRPAGAPAAPGAAPVAPINPAVGNGTTASFTTSWPAASTGSGAHLSSQRFYQSGAVPLGTTARVRRSVTGRVDTTARTPVTRETVDQQRRVLCAHCHREFLVAVRDHSYTVVCVNCGQLNRIEPG